jgi:hypothetical protein
MSLQSDLIQYLAGLGTDAGTRVHDDQVPQGVQLPFIALTEIAGNQPVDISGRGLLKRSTMRIAIFGRSAVERDAISLAIRTPLGGFSGLIGATRFTSIRIETSADEVAMSDGDNMIKGKGLDLFSVYY